MDEEIKEALKKQLQLLSERSKEETNGMALAQITRETVDLADILDSKSFVPEDSDGVCSNGAKCSCPN